MISWVSTTVPEAAPAARRRAAAALQVLYSAPSWELLLILTGAGHSHDLGDDAVAALSRALQSAAGRLSDSLPLLRLG